MEHIYLIKTQNGAAFLPQHLNISAKNEQLSNDGIDQIRDILEELQPNERMSRIQEFVKTANQRSANLEKGFSTLWLKATKRHY